MLAARLRITFLELPNQPGFWAGVLTERIIREIGGERFPVKELMRLFLAIELPTEFIDAFVQVQRTISTAFRESLRATPSTNLHLTVKFIGDFPSSLLSELNETVQSVANRTAPFMLSMSNAGAFPPRGPVRICWAGLCCSSSALSKLYENLNVELEVLDVEKEERSFTPHVTLARVGKGAIDSMKLRQVLKSVKMPSLSCVTNELTLFSSTLGPAGSTYDVVARFPFTKIG